MLRLAFLNLSRRKLRVFLLALTVIITTSFLVAVLILGNSLLEALAGRVQDTGQLAEIWTEDFVTFTRNTLIVFDILALFVGAFVIKNTFMVILAQRSKELGLLRTLGASKHQVFQLVIWEALFVGLIGGLIGIAAGIGLAQLSLSLSAALGWNVPNVGLIFTSAVFIWPIILGVAVTVTSAVLPAFMAARQSPLKALTEARQLIKNSLKIRLVVGSVIAAIGLLLSLLMIFTEPQVDEGEDFQRTAFVLALRVFTLSIGSICAFIGLSILAPAIAKAASRLSMRRLRRSRFIGLRLAAGNIWRQPLRSAATANALMIGITLIATVTVVIGSTRATTIHFIEEYFPIDWLVVPGEEGDSLLSTSFDFQPEAIISQDLYDSVAAIDEGLEVSGLRYDWGQAQIGAVDGQPVVAPDGSEPSVRDADPPGSYALLDSLNLAGIDLLEESEDFFSLDLDGEELANLEAGQLAVSQWLVGDYGLELGSEVEIIYREAPEPGTGEMGEEINRQTYVIGGFYEDYFDGMNLVLSNDRFEALTAKTAYTQLIINDPEGFASEDNRQALEELLGEDSGLVILGQDDVVDVINDIFDWILNIFRGLLSLSFVVAAAGIFNTLILSVFERRREIGLLRAVGGSVGLIRRMVTLEAIKIATLGVLLGTAAGIFFAWGIIEVSIRDQLRVAEDSELALEFLFHIPVRDLLLYYGIALAMALIAAVLPALKATRQKIIEALRSA
ncbi:ABC transporter permease [Candidatus Saccharibacteria bacterium]|nr:ABC transporter permease [Candidatus Saccharibacteria bacterium]